MLFRQRIHLLRLIAYTIVLLIFLFGCFGMILIVARAAERSGGYVIYEGRVLTIPQLEAEQGNVICGQLPLSEPQPIVQFHRWVMGQPQFVCFDTYAELDAWMESVELTHR